MKQSIKKSLLLSDSTEVDESAISNFGAHGCI
jgi:hypothetical protein